MGEITPCEALDGVKGGLMLTPLALKKGNQAALRFQKKAKENDYQELPLF